MTCVTTVKTKLVLSCFHLLVDLIENHCSIKKIPSIGAYFYFLCIEVLLHGGQLCESCKRGPGHGASTNAKDVGTDCSHLRYDSTASHGDRYGVWLYSKVQYFPVLS